MTQREGVTKESSISINPYHFASLLRLRITASLKRKRPEFTQAFKIDFVC